MKKFYFALFSLGFILNANNAIAQKTKTPKDSTKNFSFMPIPYLGYDRSLGMKFGAMPMAMYSLNKKDTISPESMSGMLLMYTTNDTWFAMFFQRFYFKEDLYRAQIAGGLGAVNFQFFLDGAFSGYVDYKSNMDFLFVKLQRKITGKLYGGVIYQYSKFNTSFGSELIKLSQKEIHGLGISFAADYRDHVYYPTKGVLTEIKTMSYPGFMDNEDPSNKIEIEYNQYFSVRKKKDVFAARFYSGIGLGDLIFNQQFVVGRNDIRGYTQGTYRGDVTANLQAEYRWNFYKKLSLVGFGGIATIFKSINEDQNGAFLPAIGTGLRVNVFPKNHMNVGIDFAIGKDDWGVYFRIGEAF